MILHKIPYLTVFLLFLAQNVPADWKKTARLALINSVLNHDN